MKPEDFIKEQEKQTKAALDLGTAKADMRTLKALKKAVEEYDKQAE